MKRIIFIFGIIICISNTLNAVDGNLTENQINSLQKLIVLSGYTCDDVKSAIHSSWDGSIRVSCNNNRYVYEIEDIGGQWTVKVK
ncbi:MAG: hypothetical protein WCR78_05925 [Arcobacteraceae bacterium]